jgi:hypothetical protein
VILLLAIAALIIPAMAENAIVGAGNVDVLGDGIFQSSGNAFRFPIVSNTNYDSVTVGNDKALALGIGKVFPFGFRSSLPRAENNLVILKSQDTGGNTSPEGSFTLKVNLNQIKAGSRTSSASGDASSVNNVKIVDNQL